MQNTKKLASLFENFGIKCWIIWSKLMQIMWSSKYIYLYKLNLICLCLPFYKVYKFYTRKYVPTVKRMNESINESINQWKFWLSPGMIKNESLINQRTHNRVQRVIGGPYTRGPTLTFATRSRVAKVNVGPRQYGPACLQYHR